MTQNTTEHPAMTPIRNRRWNGREWVYDAVHHIDSNPRNNDLANLRIVEIAENRGRPGPR